MMIICSDYIGSYPFSHTYGREGNSYQYLWMIPLSKIATINYYVPFPLLNPVFFKKSTFLKCSSEIRGPPEFHRCFPRYTWGSTFPSSLSGEAGLGDAGSVGFILSGTRPCNTKKASIKGSKPQEVLQLENLEMSNKKRGGILYMYIQYIYIYTSYVLYI